MNGEAQKIIVLLFYSAATITKMFYGLYCAVWLCIYCRLPLLCLPLMLLSGLSVQQKNPSNCEKNRYFLVMQIFGSLVISDFQV